MLNVLFSIINFLHLPFAAAQACTLPGAGAHPLFGFPHWWEYLNGVKDSLGQCSPAFNFPNDLLAVALAVIDILLRLAGLAAVVSIIIAGFGYVTSIGNADKISSSRKRIQNSLIGLAIVVIAAAVVSFVGNSLG